MKLSPNFSLAELTKSQTAERKGISNVPDSDAIENLKSLAENILQPIRNEFGSFMISSGFRCPELSIAIGSSKNSQHCTGSAADFEVANVDTGGNSGWIHCSYAQRARKELLTYDRVNKYRQGLIK